MTSDFFCRTFVRRFPKNILFTLSNNTCINSPIILCALSILIKNVKFTCVPIQSRVLLLIYCNIIHIILLFIFKCFRHCHHQRRRGRILKFFLPECTHNRGINTASIVTQGE